MNNELIELLEQNAGAGNTPIRQAVTMLRQQQAEIAELKHMNRNWQISENILLLELEKLQHRELTDAEILEICDLGEWHRDEFAINFARAVLRKAQEK